MPLLSKEEYVEQSHLFRVMHQRLSPDQPIQEVPVPIAPGDPGHDELTQGC